MSSFASVTRTSAPNAAATTPLVNVTIPAAHDLRRSFGTRWATRLTPIELKELMRHKSIETTLKYYVQIVAEKLGKKLQQAEMGDILGDMPISSESKSVS